MSLDFQSDDRLSAKLREQVRKGFITSILLLFVAVPLWGITMMSIFLGLFDNKALFVMSAFGGWILIIIKLIKVYSKSLICPKCSRAYNMKDGFGIRIPFAKRCQNCGLPLGHSHKKESPRNN